MQLPPLDPPIEDLAPTASVLTSYDNYLNSQRVSFCTERSKLADFAANSAMIGDETDFSTPNCGVFDGQAA